MKQKLRWLPDVYPFLIALYPLVNLYIVNVQILSIPEILPYVLIVCALMFGIYAVLYLLLRQKPVVSLIAALFAGMLFYVPFAVDWVVGDTRMKVALFIVWAGFFVIPALILKVLYAHERPRAVLNVVNSYLNFLLLAIFCVALFNLITALNRYHTVVLADQALTEGTPVGGTIQLAEKPDVYYLILDGYGRADVLSQYYNHDNQPFLNTLKDMGFFISDASTSNYSMTPLSLASSLNIDYLDKLFEITPQTSQGAPDPFIDNNRVMEQFRALGYQVINFNAGFAITDNVHGADINYNYGDTNEFLSVYWRTTLLSFLPIKEGSDRVRIIDTLAALPEIASRDEATFALVHILAPHPPFWFNADGTFADMSVPGALNMHAWLPVEGYDRNVTHVNQMVEAAVRGILANSDTTPIIVIQGDHGPASDWYTPRERMPILNAYLLPEGGSQYLYPTITPVNSFRLIFDVYFGQRFGLLPDLAYYSSPFSYFAFCPYDQQLTDAALAETVSSFLESHDYRLKMNDCALEPVLPFRDGLYDMTFEGDVPVRVADQTVRLQLPVSEGHDYVFRATIGQLAGLSDQQVEVYVGDDLLSTVQIPPEATEYGFAVSADRIGDDPFVQIRLEHAGAIDYRGTKDFPIRASLKYYTIEWRPASS